MKWIILILVIPYLYIYLRIFISLRRIIPFAGIPDQKIMLSVVSACRNEELSVPYLLADLEKQDYDPDLFEVLIVDDNSSDSTFQTATEFTGIKNLRVLRNNGSGKKEALMTGISEAKGELIITTDADCRAGRQWLITIAAFYEMTRADMIIGPVSVSGSAGFLNRFQELEFLALQGVTAGTARAGDPVMCNGANLAFSRNVYLKNYGNLHNEKVSGDDIFLLHSLKNEPGSKIKWIESQDALVKTSCAPDWKSFLRQRGRWISKAGAYRDRATIILAIVTFVTNMIQPLLIMAGFFDPVFLLIFPAFLLIKSVPDYLIIKTTASARGGEVAMKWFLPSQIFYPWYIIATLSGLTLRDEKWRHG
ncbi:MAG TPA: glycosyltransferase [Bacteroidales bacterium]|mgnify:CR=1 FL=1|nr:glycosyltransferase [Bacteroidales bacterium]HPF01812.1 glycosyltransferase [Bacteroidales bacterium]HPJ59694.1 glycosyltransferase [Bacteroidales bacterium]HPR11333.1 glycosyltransferase [Bacteroidales bacterium]HRW86165.1 glycosyltransferase [Bacteroidales bacterium]